MPPQEFSVTPPAPQSLDTRLLKATIVGAGQVGMACAYSMVIQNTVDQLLLTDINQARLIGETMDLMHGIPFVNPIDVQAGSIADCVGSDLIIITAGVAQRPGETRLELTQRNVEIFKRMIPEIMQHCPEDVILLIVSNPVDILTRLTLQLSGLPPQQVVGSGTVLDSSRFRYLLAQKLNIDPRSLHAYILGEHGDSEVAAWSCVNISGTPIQALWPQLGDPAQAEELQAIYREVKNSAYEIIQRKGATSYAIGLATTQIAKAILRNQRRVLTVSSQLQGEYGLRDVCLSLPRVLGRGGVVQTLTMALTAQEQEQLRHSAQLLTDNFAQIQL